MAQEFESESFINNIQDDEVRKTFEKLSNLKAGEILEYFGFEDSFGGLTSFVQTFSYVAADTAGADSFSFDIPEYHQAFQLKVMIEDTASPVWLRIVVPVTIDFDSLHYLLQEAFKWEMGERYHFEIDDSLHCDDPILMPIDNREDYEQDGVDHVNAELHYLIEMLDAGDEFSYQYHLGKGWRHSILIEKAIPLESYETYPVVLGGAGVVPNADGTASGKPSFNLAELQEYFKENPLELDDDLFEDCYDEEECSGESCSCCDHHH